jgi:type IV secretory pathway VirB6-like protein
MNKALVRKIHLYIFLGVWIVIGVMFIAVGILGIISGPTPPSNFPQCIVPQDAPTPEVKKVFKLHAISRLIDAGESIPTPDQITPAQNFKAIGRWNLLSGLSIKKGDPYSFLVRGQIAHRSNSLTAQLLLNSAPVTIDVFNEDQIGLFYNIYDYLEVDRQTVASLPQGNMIDVICNKVPTLSYLPPNTSDPAQQILNSIPADKCRLYQGYGLQIAINGQVIKNFFEPFNTHQYSVDLLKQNYPLFQSYTDYSGEYFYNWLEMPANGNLTVNILPNLQSHGAVPSNGYNLLMAQVGNFCQDGQSDGGDIGSLQISIRKDDAPLNWTGNGVDNTPSGQYQNIEGQLEGVADDDYSRIWVRVKDTLYSDNLGVYTIFYSNVLSSQSGDNNPDANTPSSGTLSTFINGVFDEYKGRLQDASITIYNNLTNTENVSLLAIIQAMLVLYLVITGIFLVLGLSRATYQEFGVKVFKFAIIVAMFSRSSWNFFSQYFFNLFLSGATILVSQATGEGDSTNKFAFIDTVITAFFVPETWYSILALMMTPFVGWIMAGFLLYIMVIYIILVFDIIANVFIASIVIALLVAVTPIFFSLILFERTKKLFDGIIKMLADFVFRSVILFTGLVLLHYLINLFFTQAISFQACWQRIFSIDFKIFTIDSYGYILQQSTGRDLWMGIVTNILAFYIIVHFLKTFIQFVPNMTGRITGNFSTFFSQSAAGGGGEGMFSGLLTGIVNSVSADPNTKARKDQVAKRKNLQESIDRHNRDNP